MEYGKVLWPIVGFIWCYLLLTDFWDTLVWTGVGMAIGMIYKKLKEDTII